MATVIVDAKPTMRAIGINGSSQVNIEEVEWCLENSLTKDTDVYAIIQGRKSHLYDIVRLVGGQPYDKLHTIYKIYPDQNLRINDEQVLVKLMILDRGKTGQRTTNSIAFILETDNYALARQTAIAHELGLTLDRYYEALTLMLNELKKGDIVDDNES